jgi:hypothetical protein
MFCNAHTHISLVFRMMLQVFQLFRMYVANVSFRYCKNSGVAHVPLDPIYSSCWAHFRRMGVEGVQAIGVRNHVGTDRDGADGTLSSAGHGARPDMERCGTPHEAGVL